MPNYIGFSSINANKPKTTNQPSGDVGGVGTLVKPIVFGKKFRMVDQQLVLQDLVNALNIRKGQKVGQPEYGTTIWDYVFEPNSEDNQFALQNEIRRVISQDPRIVLNYVKAFPKENGILFEVEIAVNPFNQATFLNVFFNNETNTATLLS
jgi:phage baseplate assembly protein W